MRSTFKVLFYLKRTKNAARAAWPVMGRITINGTIAQFSAKINAPEQLWEVSGGRARGKSAEAERINRHLNNIRTQIGKHYQDICDHDAYVTAEKVKNAYMGTGEKYPTLMATFIAFTDNFAKRIGTDRSKSTWWRYRASIHHLRAFLLQKYKVSDKPLIELEPSFIEGYHTFLKTERGLKQGSVCRYLGCLCHVVKVAFDSGLMRTNPFASYYWKEIRLPRTFLYERELRTWQTVELRRRRDDFYRDLFLFSCFTGICYKDMCRLTSDLILTDEGGNLWIQANRCKTGCEFIVRLFPVALSLIEKYRGTAPGALLFKMPARQTLNRGLERIARQCGIGRHITFHAARHTFATTICLSNDVPIETVSKMLGHKCITSTQVYATTTMQRIEQALDHVQTQLGGKFAV